MPFRRPAIPSDTEYPFSLTEEENSRRAIPYHKISEYANIEITPQGGTIFMLAIQMTPKEQEERQKKCSRWAYERALEHELQKFT